MKEIQSPPKFFLKRMICACLGHRFKKTRNVTRHFREYTCSCCGQEVANDPKGRKIVLTPEVREINETLVAFYHRRQEHFS